MPSDHLSVADLLRFLEGRAWRAELAPKALAHHREVCGEAPDLSLTAPPPVVSRLERGRLRSARQAARASERRGAGELAPLPAAEHGRAGKDLNELLDLQPDERRSRIAAARRRFRSPALVERLIAEARTALRLDPRVALELLAVAETVARRVDLDRFGAALAERLLALVEAHGANAFRVAGDLNRADALWRSLRAKLRRRPLRQPAAEAELASLEASLRQDQRRFAEADELLARAVLLFRASGDGDGTARALIQQAIVRGRRGGPAAALPLLRAVAATVDREGSPRRFLEVQHNLAFCLCRLGEHDEAARVVAASRDLYEQFADPWTQILLVWLEGRIAAGRGDAGSAERCLLDARNRYLLQGLSYSAALVTLDLAEVYVRQGRTAEVKALARATAAVFAGQEVHAEAGRCVALFEQAAVAERLTVELIARLRGQLEQARPGAAVSNEPAV